MDIIILIFLVYYIGRLARLRKMNVLQWRVRMVSLCLFAYFGMAAISFGIFHKPFKIVALSGFLSMIMAAVVVFQWLHKTPHQNEDDQQNMGQ